MLLSLWSCSIISYWWHVPELLLLKLNDFAGSIITLHRETFAQYCVKWCKTKYVGESNINNPVHKWGFPGLAFCCLVLIQVQRSTKVPNPLSLSLYLCRHQWPAFGGGWPGRCDRNGTDLYWTEECRSQTGSVCQRQHQVGTHIPALITAPSLSSIFLCILLLNNHFSRYICIKWVSYGLLQQAIV